MFKELNLNVVSVSFYIENTLHICEKLKTLYSQI